MALMPDAQRGQQQRGPRETTRLGLPDGFKVYSPFPFAGINQQAARTAMADQEAYWIENLVKIGPGKLRAVLDAGAPIYTAPPGSFIIMHFFYNLGTEADFVAIFLDDGTAYQLDIDAQILTTISNVPGTFSRGNAPLPACVQWGTQYLLIANNFAANGYWIWDGAVLYKAGTISPAVTLTNSGTGYTSAPSVTDSGGSGTGSAYVATVSNGSVATVTVTNAGSGYLASDTVTLVFSGGGGASAAGTVLVMPTGVSGGIIETFQSRVWLGVPFQSGPISNGGTILVSAPDSFVNFATSAGGLIFVNSDPFLRATYVNIKQTNGYLYPMGDSSVSVISNVQTAGNPPSTTFNYQNTDPQIGAGWRDTVLPFGRSLVFANHDGVYGLYGGAVTKVSDKMNAVFDNAILPLDSENRPVPGALVPSAAVCFIHETKFYLLLMTVTDPFTGLPRAVMLAWDGREWYVLSQSTRLTYIATQEVATNMLAFGTDGTHLFQLFARPSQTLTKTYSSKLYGAQELFITKMAYAFYTQITDYATPPTGVTLQVTVDNEDASYPLPVAPNLSAPAPTAPVYGARSGDVPGQTLGCTLTSLSSDFVLAQVVLGYYDQVALA